MGTREGQSLIELMFTMGIATIGLLASMSTIDHMNKMQRRDSNLAKSKTMTFVLSSFLGARGTCKANFSPVAFPFDPTSADAKIPVSTLIPPVGPTNDIKLYGTTESSPGVFTLNTTADPVLTFKQQVVNGKTVWISGDRVLSDFHIEFKPNSPTSVDLASSTYKYSNADLVLNVENRMDGRSPAAEAPGSYGSPVTEYRVPVAIDVTSSGANGNITDCSSTGIGGPTGGSGTGTPASPWQFGGMYDENTDGHCEHTNPATGACNCPTGYKAKLISQFDAAGWYGTADGNLFYCYTGTDYVPPPPPPDTTPPTVEITFPIDGDDLRRDSGQRVYVKATDNVKVVKVELYKVSDTGGADTLADTSTSAPFPTVFRTGPIDGGKVHSIYVKAYDKAGNMTQSAPIHYTIY